MNVVRVNADAKLRASCGRPCFDPDGQKGDRHIAFRLQVHDRNLPNEADDAAAEIGDRGQKLLTLGARHLKIRASRSGALHVADRLPCGNGPALVVDLRERSRRLLDRVVSTLGELGELLAYRPADCWAG